MQHLSLFLTFFVALVVMSTGLFLSYRAGYRLRYGRAIALIWTGSALIGLAFYCFR